MSLEIIAAGASAWIWNTYGEIITRKAFGAVKAQWEKFNWQKASGEYCHKIEQLYSTMRVLGMSEPVSLESIFTDAFILDKPTAFRRYEIEKIKEDPSQLDAKRISALRIVSMEDRLFILGKPGAGKTTFLKHIALQAANGKLDKIPIFVSIKEWADSGRDLLSFIFRLFEICSFPDPKLFVEFILEKGDTILLFDGLDEVSQENDQRARLTTELHAFTKQYHTGKILITCRIAASVYSFEQFTYVEIADFDNKQIRAFVNKWFKDNQTKREAFLYEFRRNKYKGLRELARTPLLLVLLCLVFDELMSFPERLVELYEEALDILLKKWDTARNIRRDDIYHKLSLGRKRQMFANIAADTFEAGEYFLRQDDLIRRIAAYLQKLPPVDANEDIDGDAVLKAIEAHHGIFVERAFKIYSFSHLTFQEYFSAKYIVENASDGTLEHLINNHLCDNRWREVFLLTASLLNNADSFFNLLLNAIGSLIRGDKKIIEILRWTERKGSVDYAIADYPVLSRALALSLVLNSSGISINDHNFYLLSIFNFAYELDIDGIFNIVIDLDNDLVRALILDAALEAILEPDYYEVEKAFKKALALSLELGLNDLQKALKEFSVSIEEQFAFTEWDAFRPKLLKIVQQYRDIGYEWDLTNDNIERLQDYIYACVLLTDCLKLAYVSDRLVIENKLLMFPEYQE